MLLVKRVVPRIGHLRLAAITPAHLTKVYSVLQTVGGKGGRALSPRQMVRAVQFVDWLTDPNGGGGYTFLPPGAVGAWGALAAADSGALV
jgi:hypothetical protein